MRIAHCVLLMAAFVAGMVLAEGADRPNFVWLVSEDNSKHYLKLFDENGAPTPNIEGLAKHGLVFDRAFSNSPVCSVARTTLITSCYAPRIGVQFHRKSALAAMPEGVRMFPAYLRDAGYYTTNNSKKDYNAVETDGTWDESSGKATFRNRPKPDQAFFHMQSFGQSHESSLHFPAKLMEDEETGTDPASFELAPYHPDTPTFRYTRARYHDRMGVIDGEIGKIVSQLKEDGLLEDTFVFYFGDHGGVLPRGKGYVYESGLHVPLVIRIPEKWKHLVDADAGSRVGGFVSFIDFGPTALKLAGLEVPEGVDGKPFLGDGVEMAEVNARDEAFGYADRFDEKYELIRTLRKGDLKYHRNYEAFYPDGLQNNYRYRMLAFAEWRDLHRAGKLNAVQSQFFEPKAAEALYDLRLDPHETNNLAEDPKHAAALADLRGRLQNWVKGMPDLSFYPESVLVEEAWGNPVAFGEAHRREIGGLVDVADLSLLPFAEAEPKLREALESESPWERYWALTAGCVFGENAKSLSSLVRPLLEDEPLLNRARAATFLAMAGDFDPRPTFREILKISESPVETLIVMNMATFLKDGGPGIRFDLKAGDFNAPGGEVGRRIEYFTGEAPAGPKKSSKKKRKPKNGSAK